MKKIIFIIIGIIAVVLVSIFILKQEHINIVYDKELGSILIEYPNADKNPAIDKFTYNFQYANYDNNQTDEKGATDYNNLIKEFKKFPWKNQLNETYKLQKTSPTIGIKDILTRTDLGISIVGLDSSGQPVFYVFYVTPKGSKFIKDLSTEQVMTLIKWFFERNHENIKKYE